MGINCNSLAALLYAKQCGASFARTLMIGRQELHFSRKDLLSQAHQFGSHLDEETVERLFTEASGFAEPLFRWLGAGTVKSMDYSDFEGAEVIHDLNRPLPEAFSETFDFVFDGGSLEHVFNFPVALATCLRLTATGGHFMTVTPCNNHCGHGFYQFSPELYFRVLGAGTGLELKDVILFLDGTRDRWYKVKDPQAVGRRVLLTNRQPTSMCAWARRVSASPGDLVPYQSDYRSLWNEETSPVNAPASARMKAKAWVRAHVPGLLWRAAGAVKESLQHRLSARYYERIRPSELAGSRRSPSGNLHSGLPGA